MQKLILSEEDLVKISDLYQRGISSGKIGKLFKISPTTIRRYLRKQGNIIKPEKNYSIYKFNENSFSPIDNEEKAYWLGFLLADGCMIKNKITLALSSKDEDHLEKFKCFMKSNHIISRVKNPDASRINLFSKSFCDDLRKLGIHERKTFTCKVPDIPEHLNRHLLRGLIDGDGSLLFNRKARNQFRASLCGNSFIINWFSYILKSLNITHKISPHNSIFYINLCSYRAFQFLHWLYEDSTIFMDRKRSIFMDYIKYLKSTHSGRPKALTMCKSELSTYQIV